MFIPLRFADFALILQLNKLQLEARSPSFIWHVLSELGSSGPAWLKAPLPYLACSNHLNLACIFSLADWLGACPPPHLGLKLSQSFSPLGICSHTGPLCPKGPCNPEGPVLWRASCLGVNALQVHLHFLIVLALNLCFVSEACWGNGTRRRGSAPAHSRSCLLQSPQEGLSGPCSAPPLLLSTLLVSPALPHHCYPSIPKVVTGLRRQGPRPWCSVASWGEAWWQPPLPALGWQSSGLSADDSAGGLSTTPELCTESMYREQGYNLLGAPCPRRVVATGPWEGEYLPHPGGSHICILHWALQITKPTLSAGHFT